jgi:hypothetical protein
MRLHAIAMQTFLWFIMHLFYLTRQIESSSEVLIWP